MAQLSKRLTHYPMLSSAVSVALSILAGSEGGKEWMQDPTQLLPGPILAILNEFVQMSRFFERVFGYGWGYGAFVLLTALVGLVPPIWRWAHLVKPEDGSEGISSDKAEKRTRLHFFIAMILCAVIDGYVYAHGGYTYHG